MLAAIRIRGSTKMRHDHTLALSILGLHKTNHLTLVDDKDRGLVRAVEDYVAWGTMDAHTLAALLEKRGRLAGNKRLAAETLKAAKIKTFDEAAAMLLTDRHALDSMGLKPVFRLGNPRKGMGKGGKKARVPFGGVLGNWGADLSTLIQSMM
jgi:large subunit ribosomal protein L30